MSNTENLAWSQVDVFAEQPLEGNQLAIFHDATGLSDAQMQALARETNLSETAFVLPAEDESNGVRVRIFTTQEELPFAGHPTLGTASWLRWNHPSLKGASEVTLLLNVGSIPVRFTEPQEGEVGVYGEMQQAKPVYGQVHHRAQVAAALGCREQDLDPSLLPQTVSTGIPFCIVPFASAEAIRSLQIPADKSAHYLASSDARFFYCIAPYGERDLEPGAWHARMRFYNGDDPATGSACGAAIAYLVQQSRVLSGQKITFRQGAEAHRPSKLFAHATREGDEVSAVFVGGRTIPVATGSFFRP